MSKMEMLKELENMVALQSTCLQNGDWEDFDRLENSIKNLEKNIIEQNN